MVLRTKKCSQFLKPQSDFRNQNNEIPNARPKLHFHSVIYSRDFPRAVSVLLRITSTALLYVPWLNIRFCSERVENIRNDKQHKCYYEYFSPFE